MKSRRKKPKILGVLKDLCQSNSISNTQELKDGIEDRNSGNITTDTRAELLTFTHFYL